MSTTATSRGLTASLVRGAVTSPFKRAGRPGAALPADRLVARDVRIAPGPLASYSRICGYSEPDTMPLTYPHVLGFPLAMRLMTGRSFPLPVVGLVHTWIEITRLHAPHPTEALELTVYADALVSHRRGTEVTMTTEARSGGELVWESRSGYLSRHSTRGVPPAAEVGPRVLPAVELPAAAEWRLPGDLGRRYGAASGDRNPIHLYPLTARLFGFPRPIAHGMWTVARCLAETAEPDRIRYVRADFRAPVLLPATVTYAVDGAGSSFQLRSGGGRVHLTGTMARDGARTES
ncbi:MULTISPECIES: MaoC family dehydratase [unclassified Streptomyces]|uniref:MaoC family dehydratase n=1 Tax=unclassified Streptomyces TaxID=2593676 RepID=UPI0008EE2DC8|nr:MaoC/PaaZ C-terminal domain-containing protein [Streptomyces sp. ok210]SFT16841.1 Acyl dehydratase [Streptomyces sp. ok210]